MRRESRARAFYAYRRQLSQIGTQIDFQRVVGGVVRVMRISRIHLLIYAAHRRNGCIGSFDTARDRFQNAPHVLGQNLLTSRIRMEAIRLI